MCVIVFCSKVHHIPKQGWADNIGPTHVETLLNFKKNKLSRELCPQTIQPFQPRRKYNFSVESELEH